MQSSIVAKLDALAIWRSAVDRELAALGRFLAEHELLDEGSGPVLAAVRERLAADKLVLAFVAEFSRGKSELINAIFFADTGRRVLPATPGRTTMCPVELAHDAQRPVRLSLAPIETRLRGLSLAELRGREDAWEHVALDPTDPEALARSLAAVTRTQRVGLDVARALGFWSDEQPEDNPPQEADGSVEVPAWRHALINYPHPLLQRGLVVIDTPGLNAIGAEPELTLSLLPSAHATVFVLGADTGVTRSDLAIWREHLAGRSLERFVVLNKIDALADPLASRTEVHAQIERQRKLTAQTLGVPEARVFPLSAREALAARVGRDRRALAHSRLPELEDALTEELLPRQRELLVQAAGSAVQQLRSGAARRLADRRRHNAEQLLELRGLRGKSGAKLRLMLERLEAETADFERCTKRIAAVRAVHARMLRAAMASLSSDTLRAEVAAMQAETGGRPFNLGAKAAFVGLCARLRQHFASADRQIDEMRQMLDASLLQLNTEFGFSCAPSPAPELGRFADEMALVEQSYARYLSMTQVWRLATPGFMEQFRRMLLSRLRVVFENAAAEVELWSRSASGQIDVQLRERRRAFTHRREALERIQAAAGDLEARISEVESLDARLTELHGALDRAAEQALAAARAASPRGGTEAEAQDRVLQADAA
jgi:hypothetical protein